MNTKYTFGYCGDSSHLMFVLAVKYRVFAIYTLFRVDCVYELPTLAGLHGANTVRSKTSA